MKGQGLSEGYWQMSVLMAENMGLEVGRQGDRFSISPRQKALRASLKAEMDYSSAFVVAVAAVLAGKAELIECGTQSLQPDFQFIEILQKMGAQVSLKNSVLTVLKTEEILPIEINIENSPDLFPVLAVLCAFAKGSSKIFGAPQLVHKESNRIKKTAELLGQAGVVVRELDDGLIVHGIGSNWKPRAFVFNPDQDHRMAMAGALLRFKSCPIQIVKPEVVNKSFPEFWDILGFKA